MTNSSSNQSIFLSGTIMRASKDSYADFSFQKDIKPILHEYKLDKDWVKPKNSSLDPIYLKCTCNALSFFLVYQIDKKICISRFERSTETEFPEKKEDIILPDEKGKTGFNDIKDKNDVSLFCSEEYIFCSIKYKDDNKKDRRFIYFSSKDKNDAFLSGKNKKIEDVPVLGSAFDYTGNNNNFAYFYFKGYNDKDNKINIFTIAGGWQEVCLNRPNDDTNFYTKSYIKLVYKENDLYLIGQNQKSIKNVSNGISYNIAKDDSNGFSKFITNIYTVQYFDSTRILILGGKEDISQLCFNPKNEICFQNELEELSTSTYFTLPILFENNQPSQWIRSKCSCINHSSAYLSISKQDENKISILDDFTDDKFAQS